MLIAGIIGREGRTQTANLISSIMSVHGVRTSIINSGNLAEMDQKRIKNYLHELENNKTDILIVKISIPDVIEKTLTSLHFDIIIYTDKSDASDNESQYPDRQTVKQIMNSVDEKGIIIVNMDDTEIIQFPDGLKNHIVTYGFNPKASITASSIGDTLFKDGFICCLQRTISAKNGTLIEPQEYKIDISAGDFDTDNLLAAVSFAVVNGIDLN